MRIELIFASVSNFSGNPYIYNNYLNINSNVDASFLIFCYYFYLLAYFCGS